MRRRAGIETLWRRHFEDRARWTSDDAAVSAWSTAGLAARLAVFDRLLPELTGGPAIAILDLGCGAGVYTGRLAARGHHVTAIDYALSMVRRARAAHGPVRFVAADGASAPFKPGSFDLVLCIGVLMSCERPRRLIGEAARLLRPGGALLVESLNPLHFAVPAIRLLELLRYRPRARVQRHTARAVERWLTSSGIEVRARVPIYVEPPAASWPATTSSLIVRALRRVPALWRLGATAIWWHGRRAACVPAAPGW